MDFKTELNKYVELIEVELKKYIRRKDVPEHVLNEAMEYSLFAGGKRIRPVLMISTYRLFREDIQICMPFAVAMEMIHNFSLIHDDLPAIDNDDFRHGKQTNHKKFNEATAVLAGDGLLNYAYIVIAKAMKNTTDSKIKQRQLQVFNEFSYSIDRMIAGEYVDTEYEGKQISHEYLEYMHKNKTGALLANSVRTGAILAGANEIALKDLTEYAEKIGLTFQIKDDILSEIGDEKIIGKPVGNDKKRGKCTYVTKYGLEKSEQMLKEITKEAIDKIEKYGDKAEFLKELALYIQNREK